MPVMPELSREKQEDHHKSKASLSYIMRPYLKNEKEKKKEEGGGQMSMCTVYTENTSKSNPKTNVTEAMPASHRTRHAMAKGNLHGNTKLTQSVRTQGSTLMERTHNPT